MTPALAAAIRAFAYAILHGDDEHRAWLIEAAEAFIVNDPIPEPRGKGIEPDILKMIREFDL